VKIWIRSFNVDAIIQQYKNLAMICNQLWHIITSSNELQAHIDMFHHEEARRQECYQSTSTWRCWTGPAPVQTKYVLRYFSSGTNKKVSPLKITNVPRPRYKPKKICITEQTKNVPRYKPYIMYPSPGRFVQPKNVPGPAAPVQTRHNVPCTALVQTKNVPRPRHKNLHRYK
jgi:hypothetical protein